MTVLAANQDRLRAIAVDDRNVYWTSGGVMDFGTNEPSDGRVWAVPLAGGTPTSIASGFQRPKLIAAAGGRVVFGNHDISASPGSQIIQIVDGTATVLTTTTGSLFGLAVDDTTVYWSEAGDRVRSMPLSGGDARTLASGQAHPNQIAVEGGIVYWATNGTGEANAPALGGVWRVPAIGGTPVAIVDGRPWMYSLSVGGGGVAFVEEVPLQRVALMVRPR